MKAETVFVVICLIGALWMGSRLIFQFIQNKTLVKLEVFRPKSLPLPNFTLALDNLHLVEMFMRLLTNATDSHLMVVEKNGTLLENLAHAHLINDAAKLNRLLLNELETSFEFQNICQLAQMFLLSRRCLVL